MIIAGPLSTTTACRTLVLYGGAMKVRHFAVVQALERLTETGVPVWETESRQFDWHLRQLEQCAPFQVPVLEEFETRAELESHVESCTRCGPSSRMLAEAVSAGSSRHSDQHLRELIEKSHADQEAAVQFYTHIRDAQKSTFMTAEKPPRAKREQVSA